MANSLEVMGSHQHLTILTTLQAVALACPVQSLSSPCPLPCHPHLGGRPRADLAALHHDSVTRRGTSREFTKGIAALGIAGILQTILQKIIIIKSHKLLGKSTVSNRLES
jgi:hypothetical protein